MQAVYKSRSAKVKNAHLGPLVAAVVLEHSDEHRPGQMAFVHA